MNEKKPRDNVHLQENALGFMHALLMGVAGSAPAYSIAATMVVLVIAVGDMAPLSLLVSGILMFGITLAYYHLNAILPNAGAAYFWVSRVFGEWPGFLAGWALLVASVLFMVSATLPAANATLMLLYPDGVNHLVLVSLVASGWLLIIGFIAMRGVLLAGRFQVLITLIELIILLLIIIGAIWKGGHKPAGVTMSSMLWPAGSSFGTLAKGVVIGLFFLWGWDVSLNLSEETKEAGEIPGQGALVAVVFLILIYVAFAIAAQRMLSPAELGAAGTSVVFTVADQILPRPWSYMAILSVMLSTVGTLETSMLQFSRTLFAKARGGLFAERFAQVHHEWRTPHHATLLITGLGVLLLMASCFFKNVDTVIQLSVNTISIQAAFYYGMAGFACAWYFYQNKGHRVFSSEGVSLILWPLLSALIFWAAAVATAWSFDAITIWLAVGSMLLGLLPLWWVKRRPFRSAGLL